MRSFRLVIMLVICFTVFIVGKKSYLYFCDVTTPVLALKGINTEQWCAGDVQCFVSCDKSGEISLFLDGQPLVTNFKCSSAVSEQPFTIPTRPLSNGKHELKALFVDATYHHNKAVTTVPFIVDNTPLQAALVKSETSNKVFQGRTLHVQFQVNKDIKDARVYAFAQEYECFPESKKSLVYECFVPITCEENPSEYPLIVNVSDFVGNQVRLESKCQVVAFPFKKEVLTVSSDKIAQEEKLGAQTAQREVLLEKLSRESIREKLWRGSFCAPIEIERVSCEFGTIRTTQHKGRYAHKAVDVLNMPRSVVWTPQDGVVVLKERFEDSGNTVVVDHGWGILSMFYHLDSFAKINVGDKVAKGNPIGTIGKTGWATGYHLHWEMRINNVPVDPLQWTKSTF